MRVSVWRLATRSNLVSELRCGCWGSDVSRALSGGLLPTAPAVSLSRTPEELATFGSGALVLRGSTRLATQYATRSSDKLMRRRCRGSGNFFGPLPTFAKTHMNRGPRSDLSPALGRAFT